MSRNAWIIPAGGIHGKGLAHKTKSIHLNSVQKKLNQTLLLDN